MTLPPEKTFDHWLMSVEAPVTPEPVVAEAVALSNKFSVKNDPQHRPKSKGFFKHSSRQRVKRKVIVMVIFGLEYEGGITGIGRYCLRRSKRASRSADVQIVVRLGVLIRSTRLVAVHAALVSINRRLQHTLRSFSFARRDKSGLLAIQRMGLIRNVSFRVTNFYDKK